MSSSHCHSRKTSSQPFLVLLLCQTPFTSVWHGRLYIATFPCKWPSRCLSSELPDILHWLLPVLQNPFGLLSFIFDGRFWESVLKIRRVSLDSCSIFINRLSDCFTIMNASICIAWQGSISPVLQRMNRGIWEKNRNYLPGSYRKFVV